MEGRVVLPRDYGYVMLTGVSAWVVMTLLRAENETQAEYNDFDYIFDPWQGWVLDPTARPQFHQKYGNDYKENTIERLPGFLFLLGLGGVQHPKFASACGVLWILGRIAYAKGYVNGHEENRNKGRFGKLGFLGLAVCVISVALQVEYQ